MISIHVPSFSYQTDGSANGNVHDINLEIKEGECILLCGRSGCGKTTITRLINALIPRFYAGSLTGSVRLGDINIPETPFYTLASKVGSVFQNPRTQFFNVDTESEIAFGIENEGLPEAELKARVNQTVCDLHIEHLQNRSIFSLSGGEKQKIAFASVYAMNPAVYVLDEPSSNLDADSITALKGYLQILKAQGKTIVIAEHRLYYLTDIADRIVYLEKGEIARILTPEELKTLSAAEREQMGLRAVDMETIYSKIGSITLDVFSVYGTAKPKDGNTKAADSEVVPAQNPTVNTVPPQKAVLELKDAAVFRKKVCMLSGITFSAYTGDVIAITGSNGIGKTSFVRALCGLHTETSGDFIWNGKRVTAKQRLALSYMIMQDVNYQLFAESVEAECSFGIKNAKAETVDAVLRELSLSEFRKRHPNALSGGQKQRLALAAGTVSGKHLLVFDEPTSGLDYGSMAQVAALIRKLAENKVIFIVTHDYEFILKTCTRILHFDGTDARKK